MRHEKADGCKPPAELRFVMRPEINMDARKRGAPMQSAVVQSQVQHNPPSIGLQRLSKRPQKKIVDAMQNLERAKKAPARRRAEERKPKSFSSFDRSLFSWLRTDDGITIWNRSRSMLANRHPPSDVARKLHEDYGVKLGPPTGDSDPEREQAAVSYFAGLVIPQDAACAASIFDEHRGEA